MIEFRQVFKSFGEKKILNGLSLTIPKGCVFFILGRSGTGKSVTLKHLVGLLRPDAGEVHLDGKRIDQLSEIDFGAVRKKCGLVFQLPALIDSRHLLDNLRFGIREFALTQQIEKIKVALKAVHLETLLPDLLSKYPPALSYGEQKRLALARTLIIDPDYILYDEPTTGLDPVTSVAIHKLIVQVSRDYGKTSVVVSHDMENALKSADYIVVMDAGQVVDQGSPQEIRKSRHALTSAFLSEEKHE